MPASPCVLDEDDALELLALLVVGREAWWVGKR